MLTPNHTGTQQRLTWGAGGPCSGLRTVVRCAGNLDSILGPAMRDQDTCRAEQDK